jgi:hypothetical protein
VADYLLLSRGLLRLLRSQTLFDDNRRTPNYAAGIMSAPHNQDHNYGSASCPFWTQCNSAISLLINYDALIGFMCLSITIYARGDSNFGYQLPASLPCTASISCQADKCGRCFTLRQGEGIAPSQNLSCQRLCSLPAVPKYYYLFRKNESHSLCLF